MNTLNGFVFNKIDNEEEVGYKCNFNILIKSTICLFDKLYTSV